MAADTLSAETMQAIWDVHGLGKIEHLTQPSQGNINRCWVINDAYVIRFDVLDWGGINRYAGEQWAYETLSSSGVPLPRVIAVDASKKLAPYDYVILTKLPGTMVATSLADLTPETQHKLAYTAGEYLAALHRYPLDKFGLLYEIKAGSPQPNWAAYVADFYHTYEREAQQVGALPDGVLERIEAVRATMQPCFDAVQQGYLVHGDYHLSNLLQQDGQITGVIDFDWVMSGDPLWDLRIDAELETASPGSRDAFYAGYTSRCTLPDDHRERIAFYRIGLYLDYLATFSRTDEQEIARTLPALMNELMWLEAHL